MQDRPPLVAHIPRMEPWPPHARTEPERLTSAQSQPTIIRHAEHKSQRSPHKPCEPPFSLV
ncbi:hypothetical protein BBNG_00072 [Bifidobacterium bifidum NCIMB 41171]|nr:hypothetical protein BBNG_00072 [Bifidobacterium bifidum NCIMB 41171]